MHRPFDEAIAELKLLGRGRELSIADWRKALNVKQADQLVDGLIKRGLVEHRGRNAYVLTDLAWTEPTETKEPL
jgi:hypothetical protein